MTLASFLLLPSPFGFFILSLLMPRRWYLAHVFGLLALYVAAGICVASVFAQKSLILGDLDLLLAVEGGLWWLLLFVTMAASLAGIVIRLLFEGLRLLYRAIRASPAPGAVKGN